MNIKLLVGIILSVTILFFVMCDTVSIILNNNEGDFTMTVLPDETRRGLEFDGCDDYIDISSPVELPKDNISIVVYVNLDATIKNTTSQKDNNDIEYFVNTTIKADGWHLVSTDIFNTIYLDGAPIIRRMNQSPPDYHRFIGNDVGSDGVNTEYTIINTDSEHLTFMTGKWVYFNSSWVEIDFYIGNVYNPHGSEGLVRSRALNFVEIQYIYSRWKGTIDEINIHPMVGLE